MDPDRWQRIEVVLDRVLAADPGSWPALLDDSCAGDAALRVDVESLLAQVPRAARFLASPPSAVASALIADALSEGQLHVWREKNTNSDRNTNGENDSNSKS